MNISHIDTSFLPVPQPEKPGEPINYQGWGHLDTDDLDIIDAFADVNDLCRPRRVFETGTFCGHSATLMFNLFDNLEYLKTIDPNPISRKAFKALQEKFGKDRVGFVNKNVRFLPEPTPDDVFDFAYIDGNHSTEACTIDIEYCKKLGVEYILMDNVELYTVREAIKKFGLFRREHVMKYYYYTGRHKDLVTPGILGLFKL